MKTEEEYAEEMADVPLSGSFGIDPETIINDPKVLEASRAANIPDNVVEQIAASVAEKLAASIAEKIAQSMIAETNPNGKTETTTDTDENKELEKV